MNIPFPNAEKWSDFGHKLLIPPPTISAKLKPGALQAVETIINHKFKYPHILAQALVRRSVSQHFCAVVYFLLRLMPLCLDSNVYLTKDLNLSGMRSWNSVRCILVVVRHSFFASGASSCLRPEHKVVARRPDATQGTCVFFQPETLTSQSRAQWCRILRWVPSVLLLVCTSIFFWRLASQVLLRTM
jgi:hypothetical protein